ncbi:MAG: NTP transferase domain-containing protein [Oscillospiraceae bacterium]|nr:NTP transferase domain-containing protein [Oscillospiraceae bacterium]
MKAVVMCGGAGSRLRPLTEVTPKPLIKLVNIPVLEIIINRLIKAGIRDIYLSLGYKAQDIIDFCENKNFDADIHYCEEERPLGTAGGVKNCLDKTDDTVIVLSGDNVFTVDLTKVAQFHRVSDADVTLVAKEVNDPREYGVVLKDNEGNITGFQEKPSWENAESFIVNTGIYILKGDMLDMIPSGNFYDFANDLFPQVLSSHKKFMCYKTEDMWGDIGEFPAYLELTADILSLYTNEFEIKGKLCLEDFTDERGNQITAPCLIGNNVTLGSSNKIGPYTVIDDNCVIADAAVITGSIIGEGTSVESGTDLLNCIIDENVKIGANCVIEKNAVLGYGCKIGNFTRMLSGYKIWPGKNISSESVVSRDMFYETPESIEADIFGVSGKIFSQLTLSDAVKLGQAVASVKNMRRIGIGTDNSSVSDIYKTVCAGAVRSCGVICYDFENVYKAQGYFYGAYCSLDAFIYISAADNTVNFSFFGKNGMPVNAKTARAINNNFRFSSFNFTGASACGELFRMNLLSTAYTSALHKTLSCSLNKRKIRFECENPVLSSLLTEFFGKLGVLNEAGGLQFLINYNGTDMYCIENEKFYSSDRLKAALSELRFAEGKDVVTGEDVPEIIFSKADEYGCKIYSLAENAEGGEVSEYLFMENLWNFDAVFLCVKLLSVITQANISVSELMETQRDFTLRKKVFEVNCPPSEIRTLIEETGAEKNSSSEPFFTLTGAKGTARIRQLGNKNRVKVVVEAADMETAKELSGEISAKLNAGNIDKKSK